MNNYKIYNERYKTHTDSYKYSAGIKWSFYLINKILKYIDKNKINHILDVGCGEGNKTFLLNQYFKNSKICGIDFSDEGIEVAKSLYSNVDRLYFKKDNVLNIVNNEEKYDLVTSFDVLEHVEDWKTLLQNMINVSKKYILVSVPTGKMRPHEIYVGHLRNFKKGEIEEFMNKNGLKIVKTYYAGFPFYSPLGRDWLDRNFNRYNKSITGTFTSKQKIFHMLLYILFRFFSLTSIGDAFYGLFEIKDITANSKKEGNL